MLSQGTDVDALQFCARELKRSNTRLMGTESSLRAEIHLLHENLLRTLGRLTQEKIENADRV